ncbi:unnamed protein product [Rotaria magnacalcarata]|uniref:Uncharacterized protein n=2 Tax=Rotaria magnacalcarata TaxID=392030 RepID=A0A815UG09_9BILA|nr:unnamed protein product [Rotaria magnacalcarata]CAF1522135.1 unnamed protein product [Rotaria magnacalcarata]
MATKSSNAHKKQQVDDLITCSLCLNYFADPRMLPCSHTYCLQCIRQIAASNGGQFECPMRDGTRLETNHIDSLPINRAVRDMVDILPVVVDASDQNREATVPHCDECHLDAADLWCSDCDADYCRKCCDNLHKGRILSQHRRVPIEEKAAESKRCGFHHDEKIRFLCSCEALICRDCQHSKEHKGHTPALIDEVVLDITEKLTTEFKEAQKFLSQTKEQGNLLTSGNENPNTQSITQIFSALRKTIDDYEKKLKAQICTIEEKNTVLVDSYLASLVSKQVALSKHNEDFDKILLTKDHMQLLESKKKLTNYLEQLTKELKELKPPIKTEYRIDGVDQLEANINGTLQRAHIIEKRPGNSLAFSSFLDN